MDSQRGLSHPAFPTAAVITTAVEPRSRARIRACSPSKASSRPVKSATSGGSWRGTAPCGVRAVPACSSARPGEPAAALSNASRSVSFRRSASASKATVVRRGCSTWPRSRSRIARTLMLDRRASSSCDKPRPSRKPVSICPNSAAPAAISSLASIGTPLPKCALGRCAAQASPILASRPPAVAVPTPVAALPVGTLRTALNRWVSEDCESGRC